jgi:hypothetical protein
MMPPLSQERFRQLAGWFEIAVRLPIGETREAYLTEISAGDVTLRDALERLL